jgi:ABC-type cobalamin/Fe3+-siderophores transport system ATPase subunit
MDKGIEMIGSMWNKWDLHLHSPYTHLNNQYKNNGVDLETYVQEIMKYEISLIGITNYFYFEDNELEKIREALKKSGAKVTVVGNLEFRIFQPNKGGEWINIHVLFADHLPTEKINETISKVELTNTGLNNETLWCSPASIKSHNLNLEQIVIDHKKLLATLKTSLTFGKDYLIAVCPNGYGGYRPDNKQGRSVALAYEFDKIGNVIFGRLQDREYFLTKSRYENALEKPVFLCSDAHSIAHIGTKFTWVKAKPTFQGLCQTIYEPADRVEQEHNFPETAFIKPFFSKITISGKIFKDSDIEFQNAQIPLNPNMVAIIGGRGTGKSLLLDCILAHLENCREHDKVRKVAIENISITLNKGGLAGEEIDFLYSSNMPYKYLHVSQGDINKFCDKPNILSNEIKQMLGINFYEFNENDLLKIKNNSIEYKDFVDFWCYQDELGNNINSVKFQNEIIQNHQSLINTLTSPRNQFLIEKYQSNIQIINTKDNLIKNITKIQEDINQSINLINTKATNYNNLNLSENKLILIDFNYYNSNFTLELAKLNENIVEAKTDNENIKQEFINQGINQDISSLLDKLELYQSNINKAEIKINEIIEREKKYREILKNRKDLSILYNNYLVDLVHQVDSGFKVLKQRNKIWNDEQNNLIHTLLKDIDIKGKLVFDKDVFYSGLERCLNRGKFRATNDKTTREKFINTFKVENHEDFLKLVANDKIIDIELDNLISIEDFLWKSEYFNQNGRYDLLDYLFNPDRIKNYFYVNADFTYKNKPVQKLSVGQRGTFYVCLKLATDPFGSPFVFDQPEDDLDNEFIVNELVPLFRIIKKYRQVIIVTHNANLVVNADAEQIIVADNEYETIKYKSGALEDGHVKQQKGIKASVCAILEGGHLAFEKRERKYGFSHI